MCSTLFRTSRPAIGKAYGLGDDEIEILPPNRHQLPRNNAASREPSNVAIR
jgi:hypothetical protein